MRSACICLLTWGILLPGAKPDPTKKDLDSFHGTWSIEELEYNGKDLKDKYQISFVCKGNIMTVEGDGKVRKEYAKLALKLDPQTTPKCVDITVVGGIQKDATLEGIYEVQGETLRLCVKVFGKDRPGEFKSAAGSSVALLRLKRQK